MDDEEASTYDIKSVERTIIVPLHAVLVVPELEATILYAVEQVTATMKYTSEVMNAVLARAPATEYRRITMPFLSSIANAISTTYKRRNLSSLPPPQNALETERNSVLESFRRAMLPAPEGLHWPVRVSNPLVFAIGVYFTQLKNHATVHFTKRLERFVKWKARLQFPGITTHDQYVIWGHFWRRFDTFFTNAPPTIPQTHFAFVHTLENLFRPLMPAIQDPIVRAASEQTNWWHAYLGVMKFILSDMETTVRQLTAQGAATRSPPNAFSLSPICSFQLRHIMLDNTAVTQLCALHRQMTSRSLSEFPNRSFADVFDRTKVENQSGTRLIAGTLSTDGVQVSFHVMKRIRVPREQPQDQGFQPTPIYRDTVVLGMDPNKPGGKQ
jgi:hypothetical protein